MLNENKKRNNSIDIFRYIFALIVVGIHLDIFIDINTKTFLFLSQYFLRVALPFFFLTSGYYYIKNVLKGKVIFKKRLKSILYIYLIWTIIYYIISFLKNVVVSNYPIKTYLLERIMFFFFNGSFYHLWYIPALIYTMIIITIVYKLFGEKGIKIFAIISLVFYLFGIFGSAYYNIGSSIKILKVIYDTKAFLIFRGIFCMGFPYFSLGYFIIKITENFHTLVKKTYKFIIGFVLLLYVIEIYFLVFILEWIERPQLFFMLYPFTGAIFIVLLMNPLYKKVEVASYCKKQADFVYFSHPLFILLTYTIARIIGININTIMVFFITILLLLIISYIYIKYGNNIIKKLLSNNKKTQ